ncbi:hypothetical protein ACFYSC_06095 [Streptosporangium sp. NPDC004379]|uniref:hypothetical protein n=1 Tax=Streptosporangium sp. NPDC004379 TaxID=3366189 RepID=UPI00369092DA
MALVDRECVRQLLEAEDPDTALVFVRGECLVLVSGQIDDDHRPLVVARRRDLPESLSGDTVTGEQLDALANCLDNAARDLGE